MLRVVMALWLLSAAAGAEPFSHKFPSLQAGVMLVLARAPDGSVASGSSVLIRRDPQASYLLTNHHVIANGSEIRVLVSDSDPVEAQLIADDEVHDLALLSIERRDLPVIPLAGEGSPPLGTDLAVVGYPLVDQFVGSGLKITPTMSRGVISAVQSSRERGDLYVTDAEVNPGNSGGPVFLWESGELVGVVVAKLRAASNLNLVIPLTTIRPFLAQAHREAGLFEPPPSPPEAARTSAGRPAGVSGSTRKPRPVPRSHAGDLPWGLLLGGLAALSGLAGLGWYFSRPTPAESSPPPSGDSGEPWI